jgi:microcystin-dependent protein
VSDPYLGEIRLFAGNFAPVGWAVCAGQLLPIAQYDALFNLIGTTYGGDGQTTFALPDLRGRVPIHQGPVHPTGEQGGQETVTLLASQLPSHTHPAQASTAVAQSGAPAGRVLAAAGPAAFYSAAGSVSSVGLSTATGAGQAHENMQPHLPLQFIIALEGIFPSQ